jgi:hypothetical protein
MAAESRTGGGGTFDPPNPVTGRTARQHRPALATAGGGDFRLLDLRGRTTTAPPSGWLAEPHPLRPMQKRGVPRPGTHSRKPFDAVVYVDRIHSVRQRPS